MQSSKPTRTFIVCNFIYEVCGLNDGCFFTDEIPGGRDQIKRYEYTKLQHFKHCIRELQNIIYSQNKSEAADNNTMIEEQRPNPHSNNNDSKLLSELVEVALDQL